MADGPQPVDINALMARNAAAASSGGGDGGGDKDFLEATLSSSSGILRKFLGLNWDSLFNTGLFKQFDSKGFVDGPINKGAAAFNVKGGAAGNFLHEKLQLSSTKDFSKIAKPAIEGFPVQSMSYSSLGTLSSQDFGGGSGGGRGLG